MVSKQEICMNLFGFFYKFRCVINASNLPFKIVKIDNILWDTLKVIINISCFRGGLDA